MVFKKLAEYFSKLEATASRNSMVVILAQLFREAGVNEIGKIAYLLQGRVAPLYEPIEFGMADKMVIRALARSTGKTVDEVTAAFKKTGDIGQVAQELSHKSHVSDKSDISHVFEKLQAITRAGGAGSVEIKIDLLSELLKDSDPLSAKYIARTPVDKLRLGFSDMTMLEALSWMIDGTKQHKPVIEAAYNIRPDLGFIAGSVKKEGIRGVGHVKPVVGTPILCMRAERLTSAEDILDKGGGNVAVEPKLDGFRLQLHFARGPLAKSRGPLIKLFSRGLELVTDMYPDIIEAAKLEIGVKEVVLDGEAIGFNPKTGKYLPFQETVQRKRKYDIATFAKDVPLKLVVFDCLYLDGESFIDKPYTFRREKVEKLLTKGKTIIPAEMKVVSRPDELTRLFEHTISSGLEGIMAKRLDGAYQAGARGWNWIKLKGSYTGKLNDTVDAVVMGLDYGQGKRNKFGVGAFLIGVYDQKSDTYKTVSKVGTGLTDVEWKTLADSGKQIAVSEKPKNYDVNKIMNCDIWLKPKLVGEFRADELTKSPMHTAGFALRFPRLVQWREKKPEDTTSLKEIGEMVKLQKS